MATIEDMVIRLRKIQPDIRAALPEVAFAVGAVLKENIAAQRGPDGVPWPATQDGKPALVNAGAALTAQAVGGIVLVTLTGPEARHHLGIAKGRVKRQILPTKGIPGPVAEAIGRVVAAKLKP